MLDDFDVRFGELRAMVGYGILEAKVEFDQAYAHRQHEDLAFKHPHGGGPQYLRRALYENVDEYMTILTEGVFIDLTTSMMVVSEHLASNAEHNAPQRSGGLSGSAHPSVSDDEVVIFDRPPRVGRRGPEEIERENMALQDPHHYYGEWPPPYGIGAIYERVRRNIRRHGSVTIH